MILLDDRQPVAPRECAHTVGQATALRGGVSLATRRTEEGRCPVSGLSRVACAAADDDGPML